MNHPRSLAIGLLLLTVVTACKKDKEKEKPLDFPPPCYKESPVYRQLNNQQATVKVTATALNIYLVESGAIDTKLITCDLPAEFIKNNQEVIVSGGVRKMPPINGFPCCIESLDITSIRKP